MLEGEEVPVSELLGTNYSRILTYPISDKVEAKRRVKELFSAGITALRFSGSTRLDGISVLGKGTVGIVTQAILDELPVALKIRRTDANRASMANEGRLLRLANSVEVGPRLITATKNFLAMEFFYGLPLFRWADRRSARNRIRVKVVLKSLLMSCFKLDAIGLDHGELSHAPKNVLVSDTGDACIVDFESGSTARRCANVTSLLQYFMYGRISLQIHASRIFPRKSVILKILADYKRESSAENFRAILDALRLL